MKKLKEWPKDKKIVAIDFDGTITTGDKRKWVGRNKCVNDIMEPNKDIVEDVIKYRNKIYLILWTCREGKSLKNAIRFCKELGIEFDAVNKNIVRYPTSRKILADIYVDDKGVFKEWIKRI